MCYGDPKGIKIHFLTLGKPKKQKTRQNNEYNILEIKVKNDENFHFFLIFSPSQLPKLALALAKCKFLLSNQKKNKNFEKFRTTLISLPFS
jgi:hypothetical protein